MSETSIVGKIVWLSEPVSSHILEPHKSCDERCVDIPENNVIVVLSESFDVELTFPGDVYKEIMVLGPNGICSTAFSEVRSGRRK